MSESTIDELVGKMMDFRQNQILKALETLPDGVRLCAHELEMDPVVERGSDAIVNYRLHTHILVGDEKCVADVRREEYMR